MSAKTPPTHNFLTWEDDRWHCDGRGIHAGSSMEMRYVPDADTAPGPWVPVRIESEDGGRRLVAYRTEHGIAWRAIVRAWYQLRWPS